VWYRTAGAKERKKMDEFRSNTGYNRKLAA
jgi:hypothetical protein